MMQPDLARWHALAGDLTAVVENGLPVEALYPKAENPPALLAKSDPAPWAVAQRIDHPDAMAANAQALTDLNNGASGLVLVAAAAPSGRGFGLPPLALPVLRQILKGVHFNHIGVRLDAGPSAAIAAQSLCALAINRGLPLDRLDIDFAMDPLGDLARSGGAVADLAMLDIAGTMASVWRSSRVCLADGRAYHEAGAPPAGELACVLATGLHYLRALEQRGVALDDARRAIGFLLVADADIFLTLAKFRALRFLWASVEDACGLAPSPIRLHAETSWRMLAAEAPHLNIVRSSVAAFAAALGGADAVTVLPHTLARGLPDAEARRIARTAQIILQAEAQLARVVDPAAGSGAFETLTQTLCVQAWEKFQAIEQPGGMCAALTRDGIMGVVS